MAIGLATGLIVASAIAGAAAIGTTALSGAMGGGSKAPDMPAMPQTPAAPSQAAIDEDSRRRLLAKQANKSNTILTSPTGLNKLEDTKKKTLLGG